MDDTRPARAAEQSDPERNPHFRRQWVEHVPLLTPPEPLQPDPARERAEAEWRRITGGKA